ncbi:unnamed protein product [Bursaphelenchus okinawaensis]|uniref:PH domain-containing protein n=1 Tax=Bursaphelenchus okinawaensis TaxID=465554 RepID=A0A811KCT5_9BILA|nr:unnamed protein product [Bursaphelenchus okinawaensis]CAG9099514.1 unnamed protein product [Bursaphelenchus okinawaensis]
MQKTSSSLPGGFSTPRSTRQRLNATDLQFSPASPHKEPVPFGAPVTREISEPMACSTRRMEYEKAKAVFENLYQAPNTVRTEEYGDGPTITQEDLSRMNNISIDDANASYYTEVSSIPAAPELDYTGAAVKTNHGFCKEIQEHMERLKTIIHQNCDLLGFYRTKLVGNGSCEELLANRDLLLHLEQFTAAKRELRRLDDYVGLKIPHPFSRRHVAYNMDILGMRLKLNKNYYLKTVDASTNYAFVIMIKCGTTIRCTRPAIVQGDGTLRLSTLSFTEPVRLGNLPIDFRAHIQVYQMKLGDRPDPASSHCIFACGSRKMKDVDREQHKRQIMELPNWLDPEFVRCGWLVVTNEMAGRRRFLMHDVDYPLEGTIELRIEFSSLPEILDDNFSGYLKVHQTRHNRRPEWVEFFVDLYRGVLNFYRTDTDPQNHCRPFAVLSVADICSREVQEARDKWTEDTFVFYFDYVSTSNDGKILSRRILLGTNSEASCTEWRARLNSIIKLMQGL